MENNNINTQDILEQLRSDYASVKSQLEMQEIINERLLRKTFEAKVNSINNKALASVLCALLVIIISPMAFHYNPVTHLSWAFVIGTDIMMCICLYYTWKFHHDSDPNSAANRDLLTFAKRMKKMKSDYQNWTKYGFMMIAAWLIWMFTELIMSSDNVEVTVFFMTGILFGGLIGGIIGFRMNRKIIRSCEDIIRSIEEI